MVVRILCLITIVKQTPKNKKKEIVDIYIYEIIKDKNILPYYVIDKRALN